MVTDTANEERVSKLLCISVVPNLSLSADEHIETVQDFVGTDLVDSGCILEGSSQSLHTDEHGHTDRDRDSVTILANPSISVSNLETDVFVDEGERPVDNLGESCGVLGNHTTSCMITRNCIHQSCQPVRAQAISRGRSRRQPSGVAEDSSQDLSIDLTVDRASAETRATHIAANIVDVSVHEDDAVYNELLELQRGGARVVLPKRSSPHAPPCTKRARTTTSIDSVVVVQWDSISTSDLQDWTDLEDLGGTPSWPPGITGFDARRELHRRRVS